MRVISRMEVWGWDRHNERNVTMGERIIKTVRGLFGGRMHRRKRKGLFETSRNVTRKDKKKSVTTTAVKKNNSRKKPPPKLHFCVCREHNDQNKKNWPAY